MTAITGWAVEHIVGARRARQAILVPRPVVAKRTRRSAMTGASAGARRGIALSVFVMIDDNPATFRTLAVPAATHSDVRTILARYWDHAFSYVDAVIFSMVDATPWVSAVLTVDGADSRSYRFARDVEVLYPGLISAHHAPGQRAVASVLAASSGAPDPHERPPTLLACRGFLLHRGGGVVVASAS